MNSDMLLLQPVEYGSLPQVSANGKELTEEVTLKASSLCGRRTFKHYESTKKISRINEISKKYHLHSILEPEAVASTIYAQLEAAQRISLTKSKSTQNSWTECKWKREQVL